MEIIFAPDPKTARFKLSGPWNGGFRAEVAVPRVLIAVKVYNNYQTQYPFVPLLISFGITISIDCFSSERVSLIRNNNDIRFMKSVVPGLSFPIPVGRSPKKYLQYQKTNP